MARFSRFVTRPSKDSICCQNGDPWRIRWCLGLCIPYGLQLSGRSLNQKAELCVPDARSERRNPSPLESGPRIAEYIGPNPRFHDPTRGIAMSFE